MQTQTQTPGERKQTDQARATVTSLRLVAGGGGLWNEANWMIAWS